MARAERRCYHVLRGNAEPVANRTDARRDAPSMTVDHVKARRHLSRRDPILKQLMKAVRPCTMRHEPDGFAALVRSIISQQISTRAAASIHERLLKSLGRRALRPAALLALSDETLRGAGLSAGKVRSLRDLA